MSLEPKQTDPNSGAIVAGLADAIHEHRLSPGMKLNEDEVGEIYGVSRTVVRSALQQLAHMRLVSLKRNRGAFVAQPTVKEAREVFEARSMLEPRLARYASERISPDDLVLLQSHITAEHDAIDAGENGKALHLSGKFHIEIARIADQNTLAEFVTQLVSRSSLIIALYWQRRAALCESHAHDAILDALENGEGARAEELMNSHLVDLLSALDLRERASAPQSLSEALSA